MLFLLTWNAIFVLVNYTNPVWLDSLQTASNASKNDIKTDSSRQEPATAWLLNFVFTSHKTVDSKKAFQHSIRMGKAGEEIKNLVTRSLPLETSSPRSGKKAKCLLNLAWKLSLPFSLIQLTAPGSPRMVQFAIADILSLNQLPIFPQSTENFISF